MPPLDWISGHVHVELAHQGRVRSFRFQGPFARIGEHERCEIRVPGIGASVVAYVQVGEGYLAVLDLSETFPVARCEVQYVLPGGSVWLQPNARLTLESIQHEAPASDAFSWESFELEDLRVLPNTLVLETGVTKPESKENLFRLTTVLSVLGTDPACQLQLKHRTIAKFQCVIFRGEHLGKPVRVVDLFAATPTLVDDKNANGAVLDVGGRLQCGKMILSARRVLTEALIPTSVSSPTVSGAVPGPPGSPVNPAIPNVTPASRLVEPSTSSDPKPSLDIAIVSGSMTLSPMAKEAPASIPKGGALIADVGQVLVPRLNPWEERIERNQEAMLSTLQAIVNRMDSIERSVSTASTDPRLTAAMSDLESAFGMVLEKIGALETGLRQISEETRREIDTLDQKNADSFATLQANNASQLASLRLTIQSLMETYAQAKSAVDVVSPATGRRVKALERSDEGGTERVASSVDAPGALGENRIRGPAAESASSVERLKQPAPGLEKGRRGVSLTGASTTGATGPNNPSPPNNLALPNQPIIKVVKSVVETTLPGSPDVLLEPGDAKSRKLDDPLGVASAANKQLDPDSPELLASSDSPEETLVLGSLMELRQRKASAKVMRVAILAGVFVGVVGIAVPIVWYQIPQGWRELIWRLGTKESVVEPAMDSAAPKPPNR